MVTIPTRAESFQWTEENDWTLDSSGFACGMTSKGHLLILDLPQLPTTCHPAAKRQDLMLKWNKWSFFFTLKYFQNLSLCWSCVQQLEISHVSFCWWQQQYGQMCHPQSPFQVILRRRIPFSEDRTSNQVTPSNLVTVPGHRINYLLV